MREQLTAHGMVVFLFMREMHRHMDAEEAERYLMGNSPEDETAYLEEHLLVCEGCRERISNADEYLSAMSDAAGELRGHTATRIEHNWQLSRLLPTVAAMAGALLLGLLALWFLRPLSK